jgi:hypothetical protein
MRVPDSGPRSSNLVLCGRGVAFFGNSRQCSTTFLHCISVNKSGPTIQVLHFMIRKLAMQKFCSMR